MNDSRTGVLPRSRADAALRSLTAADAGQRFVGIDAARVIAAAAVVWTHVAWLFPGDRAITPMEAGRFGVPFFICAAVLFSLRKFWLDPDSTVTHAARMRVSRILVPFAIWAIVYLTVDVVRWLLGEAASPFSMWIVLTGGTNHLGFLPFIFVVGVAVSCVGKCIADRPTAQIGVALACLIGAVVLASVYPWQPRDWSGAQVLDRWLQELPVVLMAMAVAIGWRHRPLGVGARRVVLVVSGLAFLAITAMLFSGMSTQRWPQVAGICLMLVALSLPVTPIVSRMAKLGPYCYFVYVAHVLLLMPAYALAGVWFGGDAPLGYVCVSSAIVLSLAFALAHGLQRHHWSRWLVP